MVGAYLHSSPQPFVGVRWRKSDVDDDQVWNLGAQRLAELFSVAASGEHVEPGLVQQARETFPQQDAVLRMATRMAGPP